MSSKIFFNRKDYLHDKALEQCSLEAQGLYARLAVYSGGCVDAGYLTEGGKALGIAEVADLARCSVGKAGELLKELIDRGVMLIVRGVLMVKMVARGAARSMKMARNARGGKQLDLFNNSRATAQAAKGGAGSNGYAKRRPPFIPPDRDKGRDFDIFQDYAQGPKDWDEALDQCRGMRVNPCPERDLRWAFVGKTVTMRVCEISRLIRRFGFSAAHAMTIVRCHDAWLQTIPEKDRQWWRRMLISRCVTLSAQQRRRKQKGCSARGSLATARAA